MGYNTGLPSLCLKDGFGYKEALKKQQTNKQKTLKGQ